MKSNIFNNKSISLVDEKQTGLISKPIKDFDKYILFENGDVYGLHFKKFLKRVQGKYISLRKPGVQTTFKLTELVYKTFNDDIIYPDETIIFLDHDQNNFHYTNLHKIKISDMYIYTDKLDRNIQWKPVPEYEEYVCSEYGHAKKTNYLLHVLIVMDINGRTNFFKLHRLVFMTFHNMAIPKGMEIVIFLI